LKRIGIVLIFIGIFGCAHGWKNDTIPQSQWDKDYYDCEYEIELATGSLESGASRGFRRAILERKCMKRKGYHQ
jgi:hypothetical protein